MNPDLERLIELQRTDAEIQRLQAEIAALPRRVAEIEAKLADARAVVEKAKAAVKTNEAGRRKLEGEIQAQQQKISKYRDQSLEVKTNEQYKALLQEINFAEGEIRSCEDKILELMLDSETQEKAIRGAEAELKARTAEVEKEQAQARARTAEDEQQLAQWTAKRQALRAGIGDPALSHYDRVLKLRHTALAEVREQQCTACHVLLRPQKYVEVCANQQVLTCDSCGRILYYAAAEVPAAASRPPAAQEEKEAETPAAQ
ncbi:MAG TPA: C4-type zinc ribbon domain-containing protein [Terriglobales bacterium]|nr:C4-type zinc ribbon domain-containing protein [Terriglobales bacterium]